MGQSIPVAMLDISTPVSYHIIQVTATHFKMGGQQMKYIGIRCRSRVPRFHQWLLEWIVSLYHKKRKLPGFNLEIFDPAICCSNTQLCGVFNSSLMCGINQRKNPVSHASDITQRSFYKCVHRYTTLTPHISLSLHNSTFTCRLLPPLHSTNFTCACVFSPRSSSLYTCFRHYTTLILYMLPVVANH